MTQESRVMTDECMILSHVFIELQALSHCHSDVFLDGLGSDFELCYRLFVCVESITVESLIINYLT
jgi:hypothetical protein